VYYVLDISDEYPDSLLCSYINDQSPPAFLFTQAKPITSLESPPVFKFKKNVNLKKVLEFDFFNSGADLISPKFSNLLKEIAPDDVQLIDAVVWINDQKVEGFKVMNILQTVSCIDVEKSETYHMLPNDPSSPLVISSPSFRNGALTTSMLARAAEDIKKTIVVSDSFIKSCVAANIRGIEFKAEGRYP
jgi:hypothetical protein